MSEIYTSPEGTRAVRHRYRDQLESWPVPSTQLTVPTSQGETVVIASGPPDAPSMVLLHGTGANSAMWLGDIAAWARQRRDTPST